MEKENIRKPSTTYQVIDLLLKTLIAVSMIFMAAKLIDIEEQIVYSTAVNAAGSSLRIECDKRGDDWYCKDLEPYDHDTKPVK